MVILASQTNLTEPLDIFGAYISLPSPGLTVPIDCRVWLKLNASPQLGGLNVVDGLSSSWYHPLPVWWYAACQLDLLLKRAHLNTHSLCNIGLLLTHNTAYMTHCGDGCRCLEIQHCLGHLGHKFGNDREPLRPPLHVPKIKRKMTSAWFSVICKAAHAHRHSNSISFKVGTAKTLRNRFSTFMYISLLYL
jgi:hypothetical protein